MNVVAQQNADDSRVHAIAYATELAHGADPVLCSWDFENMQPHLIQCLESGVLTWFPKVEERKIILATRVLKSETVPILCSFRTVNDSIYKSDDRMCAVPKMVPQILYGFGCDPVLR